MQEQWRPALGFEGLYEVSDEGRVRSLDRVVPNGNHSKFLRGKVLAQAVNPARGGYRSVTLYIDGRGHNRNPHRLVLEAFVGPRPIGMQACHRDGDPTNNRLDNLRWDSVSENNRDQVRHGTHPEARKTHCRYGHPLVHPNLVKGSKKPGRICRACGWSRSTIQHAKLRGGSPPDHQACSDWHLTRMILGEKAA